MLFELMGRLLRTAFTPQCCEIQVELRKETYGFLLLHMREKDMLQT